MFLFFKEEQQLVLCFFLYGFWFWKVLQFFCIVLFLCLHQSYLSSDDPTKNLTSSLKVRIHSVIEDELLYSWMEHVINFLNENLFYAEIYLP